MLAGLLTIWKQCLPRTWGQFVAALVPFGLMAAFLFLWGAVSMPFLILGIFFCPAMLLYCELGGRIGPEIGGAVTAENPFFSSYPLYIFCLLLYTTLLALAASYVLGRRQAAGIVPLDPFRMALNRVLLILCVMGVLFMGFPSDIWRRPYMSVAADYPKSWDQIKPGQSYAEAQALLGPPWSRESGAAYWRETRRGVTLNLGVVFGIPDQGSHAIDRTRKWKSLLGTESEETISTLERTWQEKRKDRW